MVPLTGTSASFGEKVRNGVILAMNEIDKERKSLEVVFEDDKGEAATAVTIANKLINIDGIRVIIGTVKSDAMLAVAPITEKNKVILFSPTAGAASITQAGDFVFRNIETPDVHGKAGTDFFIKKGAPSAAVLIANASNAQGYGNAFLASFALRGTITATSTYNQNDTDFRTIITKTLATKPDGIYLGVATAKDAGLLVKQSRELGFKGIIMASVAADAKEFFETAGPTAEGVYVSSPYFDATRSVEIKDAFTANAYDATILLYKAMEECGGDTETECIRDYLYETKDYSGISGLTTFDANGDVIKPVAIKIARGGEFVPAE